MADLKHDADVGDDEVVEIDGVENLRTEKLESYFVSLMVDEITKGNMHATTFANAAWQTIAEAMKKKTGKEFTYFQLKNKYHNLRARWSDFNSLLREKEITYNSVTGEVTATDDVWTRVLPRYRRAKSFKMKGLKDYDKLCKIFGHPEVQSIAEDDDFSEEHVNAYRRKKIENLGAPIMSTMEDKSKKKQKLEKQVSSTASLDSVGNSDNDGYGYQTGQNMDVVLRCMEALNSLQGIDGASYVKATRYIHDDPLWRNMFLCMPDERKKDWVLNI